LARAGAGGRVPLPWGPARSWGGLWGFGRGSGGLPGGGTRPPALLLATFFVGRALLGAGGCGAAGGGAGGAVGAGGAGGPLGGPEAAAGKAFCAGAQAALARAGGRAGDVRLRLTCLDDAAASRSASNGAEPEEKAWSLAAVGANARRASEDSATIAYL